MTQQDSCEETHVALLNVFDYEREARRRLSPHVFDYYAGGAQDEFTLSENSAAFRKVRLYNRVLREAVNPTLKTQLLGQPLSMPVIVAPTAFQGLAHPCGEVATARAAAEAGSLMVLSTTSNCSVTAVVDASKSRTWFQLYLFKDTSINRQLVERAESAGCGAIVLTADVPAWGRRERDMRNRFTLPPGIVIESLLISGRDDFYDGRVTSDLTTFISERFKFDVTWEDVAWLRSLTSLPIVLKGITHPADARAAVRNGIAAIIVSNHGGRQLDAAPATIDALPAIAKAVEGRIPIILDGGVRRGTDVFKALALGATAVAIGRPILWGLAVNGEAGVLKILEIYRSELQHTMTLCGCLSLRDISEETIFS